MRTPFRVSAVAVVLLAAGSLLGCTPTGTESSADGTSSATQPEKTSSTIYFVSGTDGKKEYLTADDPLVAAVTAVVTGQAEATDDRAASDIDFSSEYKYYTPELAARAEEGQDSVLSFYQANEVTTEHVGIFWFETSFDSSRETSTVEIVDQFRYSKASAAYYAKADLQPTTVVAQRRIYSLELVDGTWVITDIDASDEMTQQDAGPSSAG